jgi:hypothetical protein
MGWLSRIFSKPEARETQVPLNLSWFNTDMHSHFLPGVDDGARTMEESLAMLSKMQEFGYQKCIITLLQHKTTYNIRMGTIHPD